MHTTVNSARLSHSYTGQAWNGRTSPTERTNLVNSPAGKQRTLNVPAWFVFNLLAVGSGQLAPTVFLIPMEQSATNLSNLFSPVHQGRALNSYKLAGERLAVLDYSIP